MLFKQSIILAMCVLMVSGGLILFDESPCFIRPEYALPGIPKDPNNILNVTVPVECREGRISWHYPRGHLILSFPIIKKVQKNICFKDSLAGSYFTITELPSNTTIGPINHNYPSCTDVITDKDTRIKISASEYNVYFGQLLYSLQ
ncbi:hypothetical protein ACF0H5_000701 [Mactra antiquata]